MPFLKHYILRKTTGIILATTAALIIYLFILISCTTSALGIQNIYLVSISQHTPNARASGLSNEVRVGYFGLCTSFAPNTTSTPPDAHRSFTCFPRDTPAWLPSAPAGHPLILASTALQKNALYPVPVIAAVLFLLSMMYYLIARRRGGRNEGITKIIMCVSAAIGVAGGLTCMSAAHALHEISVLLGERVVVQVGVAMGVLLWVAVAVHVLVAGYVFCGMPGRSEGAASGAV